MNTQKLQELQTETGIETTSLSRQLADRSIEHLDQEIELLQKFIELTSKIQHALGIATTATDQSISEVQESLIADASRLSKARSHLQGLIAEYLNLPAEKASIRKLCELLPPPMADPITERREKIIQLESEIRKLNRTNTLLLQQSLDIYESIIVGITGQKPHSQTYSPTGQLSQQTSGNLVQTDC